MKLLSLLLIISMVSFSARADLHTMTSESGRVNVTIYPESFYGLGEGSQREFAQDILNITERLQDPTDPKINIIIESDFRSNKVQSFAFSESEVEMLNNPRNNNATKYGYHMSQGVSIIIPIGYFAQVTDFNEVAGLIAFQLAMNKTNYERSMQKEIATFIEHENFKEHLTKNLSQLYSFDSLIEHQKNYVDSTPKHLTSQLEAHKIVADSTSDYLIQLQAKVIAGKSLTLFETMDFIYLFEQIINSELKAYEKVIKNKTSKQSNSIKGLSPNFISLVEPLSVNDLELELIKLNSHLSVISSLKEKLSHKMTYEIQESHIRRIKEDIPAIKSDGEIIKDRLYAAFNAIQRMIGVNPHITSPMKTEGGFDPWKLIEPTKQATNYETQLSLLKSMKSQLSSEEAQTHRQSRLSSLSLEVKAISFYINYLETKKYSTADQDYYRKQLTKIQEKIISRAKFVQKITMGPISAELTALTVGIGSLMAFAIPVINSSKAISARLSNIFSSSANDLKESTKNLSENLKIIAENNQKPLTQSKENIEIILTETKEPTISFFERINAIYNSVIAPPFQRVKQATVENFSIIKENAASKLGEAKQNSLYVWDKLQAPRTEISNFAQWGFEGLKNGANYVKNSVAQITSNTAEAGKTYIINPPVEAAKNYIIEPTVQIARSAWGTVEIPVNYSWSHFYQYIGTPSISEALTVAVPTYVSYIITRYGLRSSAITSGDYFARYRRNIADQKAFTKVLSKWKADGAHVDSLVEMVKTQNSLLHFISDSLAQGYSKFAARALYMHLYQPQYLIQKHTRVNTGKYGELYEFHKANEELIREQREKKAYEIWNRIYKEAHENKQNELETSQNKKTNNGNSYALIQDDLKYKKERIMANIKERIDLDIIRSVFYEQMVLRGELPISAQGLDVKNLPENAAEKARKRSLFLTQIFGLPAYFSANFNLSYLLTHIDNKLSQKNITPDAKKKLTQALLEIDILEHINPKTRKRYLNIVKKHISEWGNYLLKPEELVRNKSTLQSQGNLYVNNLIYISKLRVKKTDTAVEILELLISEDKIRQAFNFAIKNFKTLLKSNHPKLAKNFQLMMIHLNSRQGPVWVNSWLKHRLYIKVIASANKEQRVAILSSIKNALKSQPILAKGFIGKLAYGISSGHLKSIKTFSESLNILDRLSSLGMSSVDISEIFVELLKKNTDKITNVEVIYRILNSKHLFKGFQEVPINNLTSWESKLYKRYEKLSKQYESFGFDPVVSETIQRILITRFHALLPEASTEAKFNLWVKLAQKGTTGVSDALFKEVLAEGVGQEIKHKMAKVAIFEHLVWDKTARAELYMDLVKDKYTPEVLDKKATEKAQEINLLVSKLLNNKISNKKYKKKLNTLAKSQTEEQSKQFESLLKLNSELKDLSKQIGAKAAKKALKNYYTTNNTELIQQMARLSVIHDSFVEIIKLFPDSGNSIMTLLDKISFRYLTQNMEPFYITDLFKDFLKSKNSDLGYSALYELVEKISALNKADRWQFILWLRGKVDTPNLVQEELRALGPELIRQAFHELPINLKVILINSLLGVDAKQNKIVKAINFVFRGKQTGPMLAGVDGPMYREFMINELLPPGKEAATFGRDFLEAHIKISNEAHSEKGYAIFAFLLANYNQRNNDIGTVVKNILEYYGTIGIKLGQFMASMERLPHSIRIALSTLRDQALAPRRDEIFKRIAEVLGLEKLDGNFKVLGLLGSASIKYAVLIENTRGEQKVVELPGGNLHVWQIIREEAIGPLSGKFAELQRIVLILSEKNPKTYGFLTGLIDVVVHAIAREISLPRESINTEKADQQYKEIFTPNERKTIEVPKKTNMLEPYKKTAPNVEESIRSSKFVDGKTIDHFTAEEQKIFARQILELETKRFYPDFSDASVCRSFCPDRHPGNILLKIKGALYQYFPIDFGQEIEFTEAMLKNLHRIFAASQILEALGPQDVIVRKLITDFNLQTNFTDLQKELKKIYPNSTGKPRAPIAPYYNLLTVFSYNGFPVDIFFYEFIKGIHQLTPYELILGNEKMKTPRSILTKNVNLELEKWKTTLTSIGRTSKALYFIKNPTAAIVVNNNVKHINNNSLPAKELFELLKVNTKVLFKYSAEFMQISNGEEFLELIQKIEKDKALKKKERFKLQLWLNHPVIKAVLADTLTVSEFIRTTSTSEVIDSIIQVKVNSKSRAIQLPFIAPIGQMALSIYFAEVFNAVFWTLWEHDSKHALRWLDSFMTISKHAGLVNFALASATYKSLAHRIIPLSINGKYKGALTGVRWVSAHGVSMGIGMVAADITARMINGQSFKQAWKEALSPEMQRELSFITTTFLAAEATLASTSKLIRAVDKTNKFAEIADCKKGWRRFWISTGRMGLLFVGAHAYDKATRDQVTEVGFLKKTTPTYMMSLPKRHHVTTRLKKFREDIILFSNKLIQLGLITTDKYLNLVKSESEDTINFFKMIEYIDYGNRYTENSYDEQDDFIDSIVGLQSMYDIEWQDDFELQLNTNKRYCRLSTYRGDGLNILAGKNISKNSFLYAYKSMKIEFNNLAFENTKPETIQTINTMSQQVNLEHLLGPLPNSVCFALDELKRLRNE